MALDMLNLLYLYIFFYWISWLYLSYRFFISILKNATRYPDHSYYLIQNICSRYLFVLCTWVIVLFYCHCLYIMYKYGLNSSILETLCLPFNFILNAPSIRRRTKSLYRLFLKEIWWWIIHIQMFFVSVLFENYFQMAHIILLSMRHIRQNSFILKI